MSENTAASPAFNPFAEKVIKREYTQDMIKADIGELSEAEAHEDIPEPTYDVPNIQQPNTNDVPKSSASSSFSEPSSESYSEPKPAGDGETEKVKLSRKEASDTADALLRTYCEIIPPTFAKISSFNMKKMKNLEKAGEVDLKLVNPKDGRNLEAFATGFNEDIKKAYIVPEETKEAIRKPLIKVLLEQGIALSPMAELGLAVGSHFVQLGIITYQVISTKNDWIEDFKELKKLEDAKFRNTVTYAAPQPPQTQQPFTEEKINRATEQYEAPAQTEIYEKPTFGMDDYMNSDIPDNDSTITIEEVESE